MLAWMPAVYIMAAIGLAKIFSWLSALANRRTSPRPAQASVAACALVFMANPVWAVVKSAPYYSLYLNALGFGRTGFYFPHDEMNDMGLREAIQRISKEAPHGATVGGEGGPVFNYYLHKFGTGRSALLRSFRRGKKTRCAGIGLSCGPRWAEVFRKHLFYSKSRVSPGAGSDDRDRRRYRGACLSRRRVSGTEDPPMNNPLSPAAWPR